MLPWYFEQGVDCQTERQGHNPYSLLPSIQESSNTKPPLTKRAYGMVCSSLKAFKVDDLFQEKQNHVD